MKHPVKSARELAADLRQTTSPDMVIRRVVDNIAVYLEARAEGVADGELGAGETLKLGDGWSLEVDTRSNDHQTIYVITAPTVEEADHIRDFFPKPPLWPFYLRGFVVFVTSLP